KEETQQQTDENGRCQDQNHHASAQAVVGHGVPLWDNQGHTVKLRLISSMAQFYSAKRRVTTRQIITVTCNDLDSFGQGVARHNGKALFIQGLLPQETAEVIVTEDKKQYARAQIKRRLNDSPDRVPPRCPHFGVCGGCQQQHASIDLQQRSKSAALSRLMKNEVSEVIADAPWGYRRRARLSLNYQPKTEQLQM